MAQPHTIQHISIGRAHRECSTTGINAWHDNVLFCIALLVEHLMCSTNGSAWHNHVLFNVTEFQPKRALSNSNPNG